jgi:putative ABC transport system ATP-binding protein
MIRFEDVSIKEQGRLILDRVSFDIRAGDKAVFFGPSGSGKTTILMTLIGGAVPQAGRVLFDGETLSPRTLAHLRRSIAFVGQEPAPGAPEVRDALLLPFSFRSNRNRMPDEAHILQVLENLLLPPDFLGQHTATISGGEKQRLAIARALLLGKTTFVLDEITSALDPRSRRAVCDVFNRPEITLISVSHDPEWMKLSTHFFKVEEGRAAEQKNPPVLSAAQ